MYALDWRLLATLSAGARFLQHRLGMTRNHTWLLKKRKPGTGMSLLFGTAEAVIMIAHLSNCFLTPWALLLRVAHE